LQFYLAVRKIVRTFAEDLAALGNLRSGALIALAGKIIAEDLAALGNLRPGLSLRRRQIVAADTRRVEKSMGRLGAGPPYDKGKGQITIGASPKLPSARSLFTNHLNHSNP
jgi:hypothetical protein